MEKLEGILQENVVETIVAEGGVVKSTVEHVTRAAKQVCQDNNTNILLH